MKRVYELNRKKYQQIKKMDHGDMAEFLKEVYNEGYMDGKREQQPLSSEEIQECIIEIKGIGARKAEMIAAGISAMMSKRTEAI